MKKVSVDVARHCPWLIKLKEKGLTVELNPETQVDTESAPCFVGGEIVEGTVTSDGYVAKKTITIELKCKGCEGLPEGFTKTVRERI